MTNTRIRELRRFFDRFGVNGLLDTEGKAAIDAGLKYLKLSEFEILARGRAEIRKNRTANTALLRIERCMRFH